MSLSFTNTCVTIIYAGWIIQMSVSLLCTRLGVRSTSGNWISPEPVQAEEIHTHYGYMRNMKSCRCPPPSLHNFTIYHYIFVNNFSATLLIVAVEYHWPKRSFRFRFFCHILVFIKVWFLFLKYIYIYIYIYIYVCVCVCFYMLIYICVCVCVYMHKNIYVYACIYIYIYIYVYNMHCREGENFVF